jgi:hypothetical protein
MKNSFKSIVTKGKHPSAWILAAWLLCLGNDLIGAETRATAIGAPRSSTARLSIDQQSRNGRVVLSWTGAGELQAAKSVGGAFQVVSRGSQRGKLNRVEIPAASKAMIFRLGNSLKSSSPVYSANIVGYVAMELPPGLSLICNPLYYENSAVEKWMPTAPDGAQFYTYDGELGYAVSTFDGRRGKWSNPQLQLPLGTGFYFRNPSSKTQKLTFTGEVLQGNLVNPLPKGYSMKGALLPQSGSINTVQAIPGEPGDEIRFYENDGKGSEQFITSVFDASTGAWVPDYDLKVGQGFWIQKQRAQDWLRHFSIFGNGNHF